MNTVFFVIRIEHTNCNGRWCFTASRLFIRTFFSLFCSWSSIAASSAGTLIFRSAYRWLTLRISTVALIGPAEASPRPNPVMLLINDISRIRMGKKETLPARYYDRFTRVLQPVSRNPGPSRAFSTSSPLGRAPLIRLTLSAGSPRHQGSLSMKPAQPAGGTK